jgi:hypothetical protein
VAAVYLSRFGDDDQLPALDIDAGLGDLDADAVRASVSITFLWLDADHVVARRLTEQPGHLVLTGSGIDVEKCATRWFGNLGDGIGEDAAGTRTRQMGALDLLPKTHR